jgi:hypothetical protein
MEYPKSIGRIFKPWNFRSIEFISTDESIDRIL